MSGALSPGGTTLALGTPASFLSVLQHAAFRFVPFKVLAQQTTVGRKVAIHDFPFADGVQTEDLGMRGRIYRFTGFVHGPAGPVLEKALLMAAEAKGPGLLVHPTIGARNVVCLSLSTGVRYDRMRVIELNWEFLEPAAGSLLITAIATAVSVLATVSSGWATSKGSFNAKAVPAAAVAPEAKVEGAAVSAAFTGRVRAAVVDGTGALRAVVGLPGNLGRYASGSRRTLQAATTAEGALANATAARAAVTVAASTADATAANLGPSSDYVGDLQTLMTATASALVDPADQIRVLLPLTAFTYDDPTGTSTIGSAMATMRDAVSAAARQAAAYALATAVASYQPSSQADAVETMLRVTAAMDVEITSAGDALDDDAYQALRDLRGAIVADLMSRGGSLELVEAVSVAAPMPALTLAHRLYQDARRANELVAGVDPPHPAFMPTRFDALAR